MDHLLIKLSTNISNLLSQLVNLCEDEEKDTNNIFSVDLPSISIHDYVQRLVDNLRCSQQCFVVAIAYILRIIKQNSNIFLTKYNIHRFLVTAVMSAAKFFDDQFYNNKFYATVGGIPLEEMNKLELEFLFLIDFQLVISREEFTKIFRGILAFENKQTTPKQPFPSRKRKNENIDVVVHQKNIQENIYSSHFQTKQICLK
ncbi:hypothetical protein M0811_03392 [Anaeramoeba ignava]|uniref:Cyclin n=1 Tax=Anaeramoeba ignava TaxID=1746090 RepID=A0A9Q0R4S6_ANAIG|nr:hypothetical protein M0811_03392 [Anaeramoeba ignava]